MKNFVALAFLMCSVLFVNGQTTSEEVIQSIVGEEQAVSEAIIAKKYHHHKIDLNVDKQDWFGEKEYTESIDCYFEIKDDGVVLKKIIIVMRQESNRIYQNFLFDEVGNIRYTYVDYSNDGIEAQNSAFFYNNELLAFAAGQDMMLGDDLTDKHVTLASSMYRQGLKYKKIFQGILLIQFAEE